MKNCRLSVLVILWAVTAIVLGMSVAASNADVTVMNVTAPPESVYNGENVTITATVKNVGNATENKTIVSKINGEVVKSVDITIVLSGRR